VTDRQNTDALDHNTFRVVYDSQRNLMSERDGATSGGVCGAEMKLLLVVVLAVLVTSRGLVRASATDRCPTDLPSTTAMREFRDICYQFVSEERYWTAARDYCIQVRPWTAG